MTQQHQLIPMATGEYLKSLRLERKLSLADAAKAVILDERLLRDIEEDKADHMILLYRNGYIRTYARFLKVPEDEISALLVSGDTREPALHHIFAEPPKRNSTEKWLRASSYVLASLLVGTLAWQFTHEAVRLSQNGARLQEGEGAVAQSTAAISPTRQQSVSGPVNASIAGLKLQTPVVSSLRWTCCVAAVTGHTMGSHHSSFFSAVLQLSVYRWMARRSI
jgi:cytoskeletal protein RodZ